MTREKSESTKKAEEADRDNARKLLRMLDGYRILRFEDFLWVDKLVKQGKPDKAFARYDWPPLRKILWKMATLPHPLLHVRRLQKIQSAILFVGQLVFVAFLILIVLSTMRVVNLGPLQPLVVYLGIGAFVGLALAIAARPLINARISLAVNKFYKAHPTRYEQHRLQIKNAVQKQISSLRRKAALDPEKFAGLDIELYNADYEGIRVLDEPSRTRRTYKVTLKPLQVQ